MLNSEGSLNYARVVAKTWIDPQLREKLIADPRSVLEEHGIDIADDVVVSVSPGTGSSRLELGLPDKPGMSDEVLGRYRASERTQSSGGEQRTKSSGGDDESARTKSSGGDDESARTKSSGGDDESARTKSSGGDDMAEMPPRSQKTKY